MNEAWWNSQVDPCLEIIIRKIIGLINRNCTRVTVLLFHALFFCLIWGNTCCWFSSSGEPQNHKQLMRANEDSTDPLDTEIDDGARSTTLHILWFFRWSPLSSPRWEAFFFLSYSVQYRKTTGKRLTNHHYRVDLWITIFPLFVFHLISDSAADPESEPPFYWNRVITFPT